MRERVAQTINSMIFCCGTMCSLYKVVYSYLYWFCIVVSIPLMIMHLNKRQKVSSAKIDLPGQGCGLQIFASTGAPSAEQSSPPNFGEGLIQHRCLYCIPPSQLFVQVEYDDHSPYPPWTDKNIHNIYIYISIETRYALTKGYRNNN